MISCDTNILFPACDAESSHHEKARAFLEEYAESDDFCLCEQVLMELYCLLRNPAVCSKPLPARDAVGVVRCFRSNLHWRIVDVVPGRGIMEQVWEEAAEKAFAYRRIFDSRLAHVLLHHGVQSFATRNLADFRTAGFDHLWNPLG